MDNTENPVIKQSITVSNQDKPWQFKKGVSGNPKGKPVGAKHMTTLLMQAVRQVSKGEGTRADVEIVKKLIEKAKEGDTKAIEMIFDRSDGKPIQQVDARVMQIDPLTIEQQQKLNQLLNG